MPYTTVRSLTGHKRPLADKEPSGRLAFQSVTRREAYVDRGCPPGCRVVSSLGPRSTTAYPWASLPPVDSRRSRQRTELPNSRTLEQTNALFQAIESLESLGPFAQVAASGG